MKNIAILSFLLSLFLVACGDDSSSSADDLSEESGISSSSSEKVSKNSKSSSSSSKKANKSSKSSSSSSDKANEMELNNDSAKDGDIRWITWQNPNGYGSGISCEVYDDTTWRDGGSNECIYDFGGCTKKRENKKIKKMNGYYICQNKTWKWVNAPIDSPPPIDESDTLGWQDTTEGAIRKGNTTDVIYIFDKKKWRVATLPEASLGACNEKNVGNFGYAENRIEQDLVEPIVHECIEETHSSECGDDTYYPGYYICEKNYDNKFYWETIDYRGYNSICNNRSDDANSKKVNVYWGNFAPAKKKCVNCKQESIDHFEDQCKKRCYVSGNIAHASACALGFGGCTKDLYGTIKEGPSIKVGAEDIYERYENYYQLSYLISIDSTKKTTYICRNRYSWEEPTYPAYQWYAASDFDIDAAPTICTWDLENLGLIVVGKKNKYVCEDESFRLATQEEIEEGFACTEPVYYREKCDSGLEKETGMTCAEYMRHVEKCRNKQNE